MKSKISLILVAFIVYCLVFSACGCQNGTNEEPTNLIDKSKETDAFQKGFDLAQKYQRGQLRTYRLLIALFEYYPTSSETCEFDRNEFLQGFRAAYVAIGYMFESAMKIEDMLRQSLLETSIYEAGLEQGKGHIEGKVTNTEIANMIRRYSKPTERELAYKAGYIEGYVRTHPRPDKESLYTEAEWMYLSLRLPDRP